MLRNNNDKKKHDTRIDKILNITTFENHTAQYEPIIDVFNELLKSKDLRIKLLLGTFFSYFRRNKNVEIKILSRDLKSHDIKKNSINVGKTRFFENGEIEILICTLENRQGIIKRKLLERVLLHEICHCLVKNFKNFDMYKEELNIASSKTLNKLSIFDFLNTKSNNYNLSRTSEYLMIKILSIKQNYNSKLRAEETLCATYETIQYINHHPERKEILVKKFDKMIKFLDDIIHEKLIELFIENSTIPNEQKLKLAAFNKLIGLISDSKVKEMMNFEIADFIFKSSISDDIKTFNGFNNLKNIEPKFKKDINKKLIDLIYDIRQKSNVSEFKYTNLDSSLINIHQLRRELKKDGYLNEETLSINI